MGVLVWSGRSSEGLSRVVLGSPNLHGVSGAFVNPSFGYLTDGPGALLLSTDGGKTFAKVTVS